MQARRVGALAVVAVFWALSTAPAVSAQESRLEQLAQQRAEKAASLRPHEPNIVERVLAAAKNFPMLSANPHGPYPLLGGITDGAGWLRVGVGHRRNFGDAGQHVITHARVSSRGYWQVGGDVKMPAVVRGRLAMRIDGSHLHARDPAFYGLGNDSVSGDDPAVFGMDATTAGVSGTIRALRHLSVGGRAAYDHVTNGPPSLQDPDRTTNVRIEDAPGFDSTIDYAHGEAFVSLDWRESPGYTRSGGWSRLGAHSYTQVNGRESSFGRIDAEVAHHFPFLHGRRVVAVRGLVSVTSVASGQVIPHFLLPYIGGRNSVRSLPTFRFRDRHRLLLNAEYRWRASEAVDMALFGDAGKVAAALHHLDLRDLHTSVGIGVVLHGSTFTAVRTAVAYGTEGVRVVFAVGPSF
jgi:hypothetical protein